MGRKFFAAFKGAMMSETTIEQRAKVYAEQRAKLLGECSTYVIEEGEIRRYAITYGDGTTQMQIQFNGYQPEINGMTVARCPSCKGEIQATIYVGEGKGIARCRQDSCNWTGIARRVDTAVVIMTNKGKWLGHCFNWKQTKGERTT